MIEYPSAQVEPARRATKTNRWASARLAASLPPSTSWRTAKALGLTVPMILQMTADEAVDENPLLSCPRKRAAIACRPWSRLRLTRPVAVCRCHWLRCCCCARVR